MFNDETDVLIGICDGRIKAWFCPSLAFVDKDLLPASITFIESSDVGRNSQIISYSGSRISVRKVDGSVIFASTSVDIELLYEFVRGNKWEESLRLCRHQRAEPIWATLAGFALAKKQLDTLECCLAELNEVAKVTRTLSLCLSLSFSVSLSLAPSCSVSALCSLSLSLPLFHSASLSVSLSLSLS
jgi:intraflagellar transport protein 80